MWVCIYVSIHRLPWSQLPWPSVQLSVFSCGYQNFLLERSHKWYVGPHFVRAHSPCSTRSHEIRLDSGLYCTWSIVPSTVRMWWNFLLGLHSDKHGSVLLLSVCRSTGKGITGHYWVTVEPRYVSGYTTMGLPTKSYFADVETLFRNGECAVFSYEFLNRGRRALSSNMMSSEADIHFQVMRVPAFMQHTHSVGVLN